MSSGLYTNRNVFLSCVVYISAKKRSCERSIMLLKMIILNQIVFTIRQIFANRKAVINKTVTFVILILILGSAFSNLFDPITLEEINAVYFIEDSGNGASEFMKSLLSQDSIKEYVSFKKASSYEEARKSVEDGDVEAFVFFDKSFSEKLEKDESGSVDVYLKNDSSVNAVVVKSVLDSFASGMNTAIAVYKIQGNLNGFDFSSLENAVEDKSMSASGKVPTSMAYYTVGMLLMMIFYGSEYGCEGFGEDYLGVLGNRKKLTPVNPVGLYIGKMIGLTLASVIQAIIIMAFAYLAYGVDWGPNYLMLLFIVVTFSFLATTLGAMLCILTKDIQKGEVFCIVCIIACTFLAGGFVAADFGQVGQLSPSYHAKTAFFNVMYDGNMKLALKSVGIMWAISVAFIVIGLIGTRRKRS